MREELRNENTARCSRFTSHQSFRVCSLLFVILGSPHLTKGMLSINNLPWARTRPNNYFRTSIGRSIALKLARDSNRAQQRTHTGNMCKNKRFTRKYCVRRIQNVILACDTIKRNYLRNHFCQNNITMSLECRDLIKRVRRLKNRNVLFQMQRSILYAAKIHEI